MDDFEKFNTLEMKSHIENLMKSNNISFEISNDLMNKLTKNNFEEPLHNNIKNAFQQHQNQLNTLFETVNRVSESLKFQFDKFGDSFVKLGEYLDDFHDRKLILNMANHGWYPSLIMSLAQLGKAFNLTKSEKYSALDELFLDYFEKEWEIEWSRLLNRNPCRSKILTEAKMMFENKFYYGFVCLILTQIDGIAGEHLEIDFFSRREDEIKKKSDKFKSRNQFSRIFNSLIIEVHDINEKTTKWNADNGSLNRHAIQHGGFIEYGTKLCAMKVFSLLCFIEYCKD